MSVSETLDPLSALSGGAVLEAAAMVLEPHARPPSDFPDSSVSCPPRGTWRPVARSGDEIGGSRRIIPRDGAVGRGGFMAGPARYMPRGTVRTGAWKEHAPRWPGQATDCRDGRRSGRERRRSA